MSLIASPNSLRRKQENNTGWKRSSSMMNVKGCAVVKLFDRYEMREKMETRSFVTLVLGIMTLLSAAAYLVYRYASERAYREKWKDYDDCGMI